MIKEVYLKVGLIIKQNLFLGYYHILRRDFLSKKPKLHVFPSEIKFNYTLNYNAITCFFASNNHLKNRLFVQADDLVNNQINIF